VNPWREANLIVQTLDEGVWISQRAVGNQARHGLLLAWVQVRVQLKKEKWLPISHKRHQIGQFDFCSFRLLTEGLLVRIQLGEVAPLPVAGSGLGRAATQ
jgi:hypothetical protein